MGSTKAKLGRPEQIMRMITPEDIIFYVSVVDIPEGVKLEDFGPKFCAQDLENYGYASNIKVTSNKEITLKCGTKAYQTDFTWLWNNTETIKTFQVSAYKDGKCIFLCAHPWKNHDKYEPIVQGLTFE